MTSSKLLPGVYNRPWHPVLVTVPIGAWVSSLVFDIASHVVPDGAPLVMGARWLIAIGIVGAVLAALVGFVDLITAIPPDTQAFRTAVTHMGLSFTATGLYVANFAWRLNADATEAVPVGPMALAAVTIAILGVSGYLGGKLAHRDDPSGQHRYDAHRFRHSPGPPELTAGAAVTEPSAELVGKHSRQPPETADFPARASRPPRAGFAAAPNTVAGEAHNLTSESNGLPDPAVIKRVLEALRNQPNDAGLG